MPEDDRGAFAEQIEWLYSKWSMTQPAKNKQRLAFSKENSGAYLFYKLHKPSGRIRMEERHKGSLGNGCFKRKQRFIAGVIYKTVLFRAQSATVRQFTGKVFPWTVY